MQFTIKTDDKPHLNALLENPATKKKAMEVISTFVSLMEEACDPDKGIAWVDLPKEFSSDLSFRELIYGILRGSLDLKDIDKDTFDVLKIEAHPLSMLAPRKSLLGNMKYPKWRQWARMPEGTEISEEVIAEIFRTLLRYYRYVDFKALAEAIIYEKINTFKALADENIKTLPMYPAMRYQKEHFGDLKVGTFLSDIGAMDCGAYPQDHENCPACGVDELKEIGKYLVCLSCNAGFES